MSNGTVICGGKPFTASFPVAPGRVITYSTSGVIRFTRPGTYPIANLGIDPSLSTLVRVWHGGGKGGDCIAPTGGGGGGAGGAGQGVADGALMSSGGSIVVAAEDSGLGPFLSHVTLNSVSQVGGVAATEGDIGSHGTGGTITFPGSLTSTVENAGGDGAANVAGAGGKGGDAVGGGVGGAAGSGAVGSPGGTPGAGGGGAGGAGNHTGGEGAPGEVDLQWPWPPMFRPF